jgi:hypothetical protein
MDWPRIHKNILLFLKVLIIRCRASKHQIFWTHQCCYDYKGNPMLLDDWEEISVLQLGKCGQLQTTSVGWESVVGIATHYRLDGP